MRKKGIGRCLFFMPGREERRLAWQKENMNTGYRRKAS
nr:MAG TPA: hypothetical protein [Caudoviricetes sp.]